MVPLRNRSKTKYSSMVLQNPVQDLGALKHFDMNINPANPPGSSRKQAKGLGFRGLGL